MVGTKMLVWLLHIEGPLEGNDHIIITFLCYGSSPYTSQVYSLSWTARTGNTDMFADQRWRSCSRVRPDSILTSLVFRSRDTWLPKGDSPLTCPRRTQARFPESSSIYGRHGTASLAPPNHILKKKLRQVRTDECGDAD